MLCTSIFHLRISGVASIAAVAERFARRNEARVCRAHQRRGHKMRRRVDSPLGTERKALVCSHALERACDNLNSGSGARGRLNARSKPFGRLRAISIGAALSPSHPFSRMDIALDRAPICAMGQPFDGEFSASALPLGSRLACAILALTLRRHCKSAVTDRRRNLHRKGRGTRGLDDKTVRLEFHPMAQSNCKCSVMQAQLSALFRDVNCAIFRDNGTDFCGVTLRMDVRYGVDWRGIGEVV